MDERRRSLGEVLQLAAAYLTGKSVENPRLAAEYLAARLLGCRRLELPTRAGDVLSDRQLDAMRRGIKRVGSGEPVQYVLGQWQFCGHTLKVDRRALIPRPETEELVQAVLDCAALWRGPAAVPGEDARPPIILDVGTGSGCIVISLALARPNALYLAFDTSAQALELARENAAALGVAGRVGFLANDLSENVEPAMVSAIVANLPYVPTAEYERLPTHIRDFEPRSALDGGPDGLAVIRPAVQDAVVVLKPGGRIFLEIGTDQAGRVTELLQAEGLVDVHVLQDMHGKEPHRGRKRMRCLARAARALAYAVLALLILAGIVRLVLPSTAVWITNRQLARALRPEAELRDVTLTLSGGRAGAHGFRIDQPPGFFAEPFLDVPHVDVQIDLASLFRRPIVVEEVVIRNAALRVIKNEEGGLNAQSLVLPRPRPDDADRRPARPRRAPPAVTVRRILVKDCTVSYTEFRRREVPLVITVTNIDFEASDIVFDVSRAAEKALPGRAILTALIDQRERPVARLGVAAHIGVLTTNIPPLNAAARLVGFELDTVGHYVPRGTVDALGGSCLDAAVDVAVAPELLDCRVAVTTVGAPLTLNIGGTPRRPRPDMSSTLLGVMGFAGSSVGHRVAPVGTAVDTVSAAVKGAGRVVGSVGGGLFRTLKGLFTADLRGVGEGLGQTVVGTAVEVAGTATNVVGTMAHGVARAARVAAGWEADEEWRQGGAARWRTAWPQARDKVAGMPFPERGP